LDREAEMIAHDMLEVILSGVRTPERPASPEDAYLTDEQTFSMLNPSVRTNYLAYLTRKNPLLFAAVL
jgi:MYCBP-associated protein family